MTIYDFERNVPEIHESVFVAEDANIIGKIMLNEKSSVWFCSTLRGDNELISVGFGSNIQENCVLHTDIGFPLTIGKNCTIGHKAMLHGCTIGDNTLIGMGATILNGAQIGKNCHISGGAGIGGVLEPLQANPVIIEDNCFIGARSEVAEGVIVGEGAVLSMGVFIGASTKIVDRSTGEIHMGKVPAYSVVVPGTLPGKKEGDINPSLYCAVIVKRVDEKTRSKTSINDLLRY